MKNTRFPARFLALFLAVCMAASLTSLPVLAEEPESDPENSSQTLEGRVSVVVDNDNYTDDVSVYPNDGAAINVNENNPYQGYVVSVSPATETDPMTVAVAADVNSGFGFDPAVKADVTNNQTVTVNVTGDINATGTGVDASSEGGGTTIINAENVGQPDKPVGGTGVEASATGSGSTTTVNVGTGNGDSFQGGDIYATGTGVEASATGGGTATVNAGSVSASGEGSTGISVSVSEGGTANVTVGKDDASGADAAAEGEATVAGETAASSGVQAENAASAAESTGTDASGTEGSAETPAVKADGTGIDVDNFGGKVNVTVDGDVEAATGIDITLSPAVEEVAIGEVTEGTGAVSGQDNAASEQAENKNQTTVTVDGDVNATKTGLSVVESSDFSSGSGPHIGETEKVDVVITGTLSAGEKAVVVDEHVTEDNLSLTVWKIEVDGNAPTENDTLVQPAGGDNGNEAGTSGTVENAYNTGAVSTSESSTSVAADTSIAAEPSARESKTFTDASIQYIIRVDTNVHNSDGTNAGTLSAKQDAALEKDLATGTAGGETYQYAHENDKVYLKIDVTDDSFEVDKAYGDEGVELELIQDEGSGSYYVVVPKGGGVYLSVTLKDKSQDNNENENNNQNNQNQNQEQNNQNQNQEQNNQNQQQNQNQEQNNNPIPANAEKAESLIKVSVATATDPAPAAPITPPAKTERTVKGTVDHATHLEKVDDVVNQLEGNTLTDLQNGNAAFAAAFDIKNASMLASGVVHFKGAYDEAEEDVILVPSESRVYFVNNTYTVVLSDGTVLEVKCTDNGVLDIPFPKDAAGMGFVVLLGGVENNPPLKPAKLATEAFSATGYNSQWSSAYINAYINALAAGKVGPEADAATKAALTDQMLRTDIAEMESAVNVLEIQLNNDEVFKNIYISLRLAGYPPMIALDGADDIISQNIGEARSNADRYRYTGEQKDLYIRVYLELIAKGVDKTKASQDAQQSAANANAAGTTTEATSAAGGPAADPDIIRDDDALIDAAIKSALEDARNAQQSAATANAAAPTEAISAAGGDAAHAGSFDDDDLAALDADALNSILENDQNARNAQRSAANANAAGTTEATTAAVNRGDVADNAQQTNNANALGVYSPTGDHSGALGD